MVALGARGSPRAGSPWLLLLGLGWVEAGCAGLSPVPWEWALGWDSPAKAGWAQLLARLQLSWNLLRQSLARLPQGNRQRGCPRPTLLLLWSPPDSRSALGSHRTPAPSPVLSRAGCWSRAWHPPIILSCPSVLARTAPGASHQWGAPAATWKMQGNGGQGRRGGLGP